MTNEGEERCRECGELLMPGDVTGETYSHETHELVVTWPLVCENRHCPTNDNDLAPAAEEQSQLP